MPVETGYRPTTEDIKESKQWREGETYQKYTTTPDKKEEALKTQIIKDQETPAGAPEITVKTSEPEEAIAKVQEGTKAEQKKEGETAEKKENLISQIENDLALEKAKLTGEKNAYPESYQKDVRDHIKFLESALTREKAKQEAPIEIKETDQDIKALESILKRDDIGPKDRARFEKMLTEKQALAKDGREIKKGEISPETIKKDEIITEVAIRAVDPKGGKNVLENNHIVSYASAEIKDILDKEKDPTKRSEELKKYLVGSLDESIKLRNEAKYGSGFMGKLKKFFNEGWGGALAKTAAGGGLIATGLANPALGIFAPMIYAAGFRLAAEGLTQIGQEINDAFNKNSRKALFEQGRGKLDEIVKAKLAELAKNPEITTDEQRNQALMEFIDKTYANEVKTLVDQDTNHLRKAEKLRRHMGWAGTAAGILVGMPMDIDANGVAHFVNFFQHGVQGSWFSAGAAHGFGNYMGLGSWGAIENIASFGAGSLATYAFARGTEGDERKFQLELRTTKEEQKALDKTQKNAEKTPVSLTKETIKGATKEESVKNAQEIAKDAKEKGEKEKSLDKIVDEIENIKDAEALKEQYEQTPGGNKKTLLELKALSDFYRNIDFGIGNTAAEKKQYISNLIDKIQKNIIDVKLVSDEKAGIIKEWMAAAELWSDHIKDTKRARDENYEEAMGPITDEELKEPKKEALKLDSTQQHLVNEQYYDYLKDKYPLGSEAYNNAYYGNKLKKWLDEGSLTGVIDPNNIAGSKDKFFEFLDKQDLSVPGAESPEKTPVQTDKNDKENNEDRTM